jgi:hypothetical protein
MMIFVLSFFERLSLLLNTVLLNNLKKQIIYVLRWITNLAVILAMYVSIDW